MSDVLRIVETWLQTDAAKEVTSENYDQKRKQVFYLMTDAIFRTDLIRFDGSVFKPPSGATWLFGIDDSFDPEHADPVFSDNDQFNIGADRPDDLDVDNGKICWRANFNSTALVAAMAQDAYKEFYAELWMAPAGENATLLAQWQVIIRNIVTDVAQDAQALVYTSTAALRYEPNGDIILLFEDGAEADRWEK